MDTLIRILITLFSLVFSAGTVPPDSASQSATMRVDTVIEEVSVGAITSAYPALFSIRVRGYQPDGCDYPVEIVQSRGENTVEVHIFREIPPNILRTMQLVPYDAYISLGTFMRGTYQINVNGVLLEVSL